MVQSSSGLRVGVTPGPPRSPERATWSAAAPAWRAVWPRFSLEAQAGGLLSSSPTGPLPEPPPDDADAPPPAMPPMARLTRSPDAEADRQRGGQGKGVAVRVA